MRSLLSFTPGILVLSYMLVLQSCGSRTQWEEESAELLRKTTALEELHLQLNARIDSLWDTTTTQLAVMIPADFPPTDRDIFLNARNADHMKMFMSFELLSEDAKTLVMKAGEYDQFLAKQIHHLIAEREKFEEDKNRFLTEVQHEDEAASRQYADKFRMASLKLFR